MLLGVVLVAGLAWVLGPGAAWVLAHFDGVRGLAGKDLAAALDAIRGRALAIATGLIALVAVYYTARNADTARRTFKLGEQGHVTDRYTKAIEQLGSDKLDIRLGGIYALERIARDSARDHPTVMEVLAAFIREHSLDDEFDKAGNAKPRGSRRRTDLQAAASVIGRRVVSQDPPDARINLSGATLASANLTGANLSNADLTEAYLSTANLTEANFCGTDLSDATLIGADLTRANLSRAILFSADLSGANFTGADLTDADLDHADLNSADLADADLTDVDLTRTNLTDVVGLPERLRLAPSQPAGADTEEGSR
ncbi:pentapeptide repeat-containing protein [Streptosporangium roseum]|uniref:pentapeptide repeat-containing protein n=1 Tax=Streptosporangium roseum TaxID=2001 RepID=UPI000689338B|nr:pentapeptide repeat-containing protein [Streptosporangium roseum]